MAFRTQKISQMTPKGADLEATDLIEVSTIESGSYVTRSITGQELIDAIPPTTIEWGDIGGTLSDQTDLNTALNAKVPTSRTLTINGVTQDLSADRTFTISTGITIGSTAITSGTVGRVLFQGTGNVVQQSSSLFWDTSGFLGIGTTIPVAPIGYNGITINSATNGAYTWFQTGGVTKYSIGTEGNVNYHNLVAGTSFLIRSGGSSYFNVVQSTGNVQIGTTTDAGFRLDVNGTARVQGNAQFGTGFYWDNTNNRLGIGVSSPARRIDISGSGDVLTGLKTTSATGAASHVVLNDINSSFEFGMWGSTRTGYGAINANNAFIFGAVDFAITSNSNIKFGAGATPSERMRIVGGTGNVLINTTTDAGFRLDVNGTARVDQTLQLNGTGTGILIAMGGNIGRFTIDGSFIRFKVSGGGDILNMTTNFFGVNETSVIPSAICAMTSTNRGFLPPRMTTTQKNAIATPAAGLMVYDTTLNVISYYNGSMWI